MYTMQQILNKVRRDDGAALSTVESVTQALNAVYDDVNDALRITGISGGSVVSAYASALVWVSGAMVIPAAIHGQGATQARCVCVQDSTLDIVLIDVHIAANGDVTLTTETEFSGFVIIQ